MQAPSSNEEQEALSNPTPSNIDDGVDVSLIRWTLSLSASERLALLQRQANSLSKLRDSDASS